MVEIKDELQEAYDKIAEELNIPVLKMHYIPEGMKFDTLIFENQRAFIIFSYRGHSIWLAEVGDVPVADNIHVSDREYFDDEYNRRLGETVYFSRNRLENGDIEYSAEIMKMEAYYYISGIMEEEDLRSIVQQMYFD